MTRVTRDEQEYGRRPRPSINLDALQIEFSRLAPHHRIDDRLSRYRVRN